MTIAQKKAKLNGWIKEYELRIEKYKKEYGERSFKYSILKKSCIHKIASWGKEIKNLEKIKNNKPLIKKYQLFAEDYFGVILVFNGSRNYNIHNYPIKYFLVKFLVECGFGGKQIHEVLHCGENTVYRNRESATNYIKKDKNLRLEYKKFKKRMDEIKL